MRVFYDDALPDRYTRALDMVDKDEFDLRGKRVLELGAGAGLPALICALVRRVDKTLVLRFALMRIPELVYFFPKVR